MDIACKRCPYHTTVTTVTPGATCPDCGAFLCRRVAPSPTPSTHARAVVNAILSPQGLVTLVVVALMLGQNISGRLKFFGSLFLFVSAVRLAWGAVNMKDTIQFPSLSPADIMNGEVMTPAFVYSLVFSILPTFLLLFAAVGSLDPDDLSRPSPRARAAAEAPDSPGGWDPGDDPGWREGEGGADEGQGWMEEDPGPEPTEAERAAMQAGGGAEAAARATDERKAWAERERAEEARQEAEWRAQEKAHKKKMKTYRVVAGITAALLLLYAVMALVLFLVTNSTWGMFSVVTGLQLMRADPGGYASLTAMVAFINVGKMLTELDIFERIPFLGIGMAVVKGGLTLLVYGICGLFVRKHARLLQLPVDEHEWEPIPAAPVEAWAAAPATGTPRTRGGTSPGAAQAPAGTAPAAEQAPVAAAPAPRRHEPIALELEDDGPPLVSGTVLMGAPEPPRAPPPQAGTPLWTGPTLSNAPPVSAAPAWAPTAVAASTAWPVAGAPAPGPVTASPAAPGVPWTGPAPAPAAPAPAPPVGHVWTPVAAAPAQPAPTSAPAAPAPSWPPAPQGWPTDPNKG